MNQKQIIKNCILGAKKVNQLNDEVCNLFNACEWDELLKVTDYFMNIALDTLELTDDYERDEFINRYFDIILDFENEFEDIEKALVYLLLEG